jgi:hypothetical protein
MLDLMRNQLGNLIALGIAVVVAAGGPDTAAAFSAPRGGVVYGATVVEQVDGQTLWIDLGPAKGSEPRGVVVVHANRFTRFNLTAGVYGAQVFGSLGAQRIGSGMSVTVVLGVRPRADGSLTLVELTTNTR